MGINPPGSIDEPDQSLYPAEDRVQAAVYRAYTVDALRSVCKARYINSPGRKAILLDFLVRSKPGLDNPIQRSTLASKPQMGHTEDIAERNRLWVPPRSRSTGAGAAKWILQHAPFVPQ